MLGSRLSRSCNTSTPPTAGARFIFRVLRMSKRDTKRASIFCVLGRNKLRFDRLRSHPPSLAAFCILAACSGTVSPLISDAGMTDGAGSLDTATADRTGPSDLPTVDDHADVRSDRVDGAVGGFDWCRCGAGERCCPTTGQCLAPVGFRARCSTGSFDAGADTACVDNTDCPAGLTCQIVGCSSPGVCTGVENCDRFRGPACACDGTTMDGALACRMSIPIVGAGGCGVIPAERPDAGTVIPVVCGSRDEFCPAGQRCCPVRGVCVDADCGEECCRLPSPGTEGPCRTQQDCAPAAYCRVQGCGAAGDCVRRGSPLMCPPVLAPVCGCDGQTYLSECLARASGVNVARAGACTP